MSSVFLSPEVFIELFLESLLLFVLSFTLFQTLYILKNYKSGTTTPLQYELEKKSYLIGSVVSISILLKIALLPFFIHSLGELSLIIPGAMCAMGAIGSNSYGVPLLFLKLGTVLISSLWLLLNREDLMSKSSIYFKKKMLFFIFIYLLFLVELLLSIAFYGFIPTENPVLCCSAIFTYDQIENPIPFNLGKPQLVSLFYLLYLAVVVSAYRQKKLLLLLFSSAFIYASYYAIVYFFSSYIYEIPTHKCPFCMLQKEYYYVGYFIYIPMLIGIFYTLAISVFGFMDHAFKKVLLYYTVFVSVLSAYLIAYLLRNNVFL